MSEIFHGRDPYDDVPKLYEQRQTDRENIFGGRQYWDGDPIKDDENICSKTVMENEYKRCAEFDSVVKQELAALKNAVCKIPMILKNANARSFQPAIGQMFTLEWNTKKRFVAQEWNGSFDEKCDNCVFKTPLWASGGNECLSTNCGTVLRQRRDGKQVVIKEIEK